MTIMGSEDRPVRVAIVGAGPSGFYTAAALLTSDFCVSVDLYDRFPVPFGLVRGGVAPDHPKIKRVTAAYSKTAQHPRFRFIGNVRLGLEVQLDALMSSYDQVVLTHGAESARRLGIEGEELAGSHSATEFVGWYNGHPDHQGRSFDLNVQRAAVIGVGNVAMDVARILVRDPEELASTDITPHALAALRASAIEEVHVFGRRGPIQAAFSASELKEIDALPDVDVVVREQDIQVDAAGEEWLANGAPKSVVQNVALLRSLAARRPTARRRVHIRLFTFPVSLSGAEGRVSQITLGRNMVALDAQGNGDPSDTGDRGTLDVGLVLRAVGYRGVRVPGVPFDEARGVVPNHEGAVLDGGGDMVPRLFTAGWAKRGPSGLIGSNRACAKQTVARMQEEWPQLRTEPRRDLPSWGHRVVDWSDWERIDAAEQAAGQVRGAPREKFTSVDAMLRALDA